MKYIKLFGTLSKKNIRNFNEPVGLLCSVESNETVPVYSIEDRIESDNGTQAVQDLRALMSGKGMIKSGKPIRSCDVKTKHGFNGSSVDAREYRRSRTNGDYPRSWTIARSPFSGAVSDYTLSIIDQAHITRNEYSPSPHSTYSLTNANFRYNSSLNWVEMGAFRNNTFSMVNFPYDCNLPQIPRHAFEKCEGLKFIRIPNNVTEIKQNAFKGCNDLKRVVLNDGLVEIGRNAFAYCNSLKKIIIPDSVKKIGPDAFKGCFALSVVHIGAGVETILNGAFAGCVHLRKITVDPNNPYFVVTANGVLMRRSEPGKEPSRVKFVPPKTTVDRDLVFDQQCLLFERKSFNSIELDKLIIDTRKHPGEHFVYFDPSFMSHSNSSENYRAYAKCPTFDSRVKTTINELHIYGNNQIAFGKYSFYGCGVKKMVFESFPKYTRHDFDNAHWREILGKNAFGGNDDLQTVEFRVSEHFTEDDAYDAWNLLIDIGGVNPDNVELVITEAEPYPQPELDYLAFECLDGDFDSLSFTLPANMTGNTVTSVSFSVDDGKTWETYQYSSNGLVIDVMNAEAPVGNKVLFKGIANQYGGYFIDSYGESYTDVGSYFMSDNRVKVSGNIMSLFYGDRYESRQNKFPKNSNYNCYGMFSGFYTLVDAKDLIMPAMSATTKCYNNMFFECTSLTSVPELPATTLAQYCYNGMFADCTSLMSAPVLSSTTLADNCYSNMFNGCTSLASAPELPAMTLANYCYQQMFQGCTSLMSAPELPATTLAEHCYNTMFAECTDLTTAPVLPATTLADSCYNTMFYGCASLTLAPELPATTLENYCYSRMFYGCTSLTSAPELPATTLENYCYSRMFYGCTNLNYIKAMFTTTPSTTYTNDWVSGVAATGTFVKNSAATWNVTGTNGVPTGWTVETASS